MRNRFKIILTIITVLIIIILALLISLYFKPKEEEKIYNKIDVISDYGYTLEDRDSTLMQEKFNELKDVLTQDNIDFDEYAKLLSELFIIDLYTLDNKDNKYDVGSLEYILDDVKENYKLNVEDTLYKYIIDKNNNEREALPIVSSIEISNNEKTTYSYDNIEYEAYKINLTWEYVSDLGYDKKGEIVLIKKDNKLYIVSYKGVSE